MDGIRFGRRRLLAGGLTLAAGAALGVNAAASPARAELVGFGQVGRPGWPLRLWTGFTVDRRRPLNAHDRAARSFRFDPVFHATCDDWATYFHAMWSTYRPRAAPLDWIGCSFVYRSYPVGSNHTTGNALDLTAMYFRDGDYIDCRFSHLPYAPSRQQRWYGGLAWTARRFFPELGTAGTGPSHDWHVHLGRWVDGAASILLSRGSWDTWLVQRTCRTLLGTHLVLDGVWEARTERAFQRLLRRLGLAGANPFADQSDFVSLAYRAAAGSFAGGTAVRD